MIENKKVLVTGACGSIGSELARQVLKHNPKEVFVLDHEETLLFDLWETDPNKYTPILADIKDKEDIEKWVNKYKPDIIMHCAAYKHVVMGEKFPAIFEQTNVEGTRNLVDSALKNKVKSFVLISTDKAVNPECVMGRTKRAAEKITQKAGYVVVRFGNVLASRGSVIEIWRRQIEQNKNITVTHPDMRRYFMSIPQACKLILQAERVGNPGEIIVLDMGEPMRIYDLAKTVLKLSGRDLDIEITQPKKGEKLFEQLIQEDEVVEKRGKLFIVKK